MSLGVVTGDFKKLRMPAAELKSAVCDECEPDRLTRFVGDDDARGLDEGDGAAHGAAVPVA